MSIMIYHSVATKEVKPDIVDLAITINAKAQTAKEAISKINEDRNTAKTYITSKTSYRQDSYHQMDVDLKKRTTREYYYVHKKTKKEISHNEYEKLNQDKRNEYDNRSREKFLYYEAILHLVAVLNYGETAVDDLMNIFNMCTEKDFKCTYQHTVSDELNKSTEQELYAMCINQGVKEVQTIASKLDFLEQPKVHLLEVLDPAATAVPKYERMGMMSKQAMCMDEAACVGSAYEPEQIIMPELIEELFNNNIELKKSLDLKLEF